jgi:hypothetical protein
MSVGIPRGGVCATGDFTGEPIVMSESAEKRDTRFPKLSLEYRSGRGGVGLIVGAGTGVGAGMDIGFDICGVVVDFGGDRTGPGSCSWKRRGWGGSGIVIVAPGWGDTDRRGPSGARREGRKASGGAGREGKPERWVLRSASALEEGIFVPGMDMGVGEVERSDPP